MTRRPLPFGRRTWSTAAVLTLSTGVWLLERGHGEVRALAEWAMERPLSLEEMVSRELRDVIRRRVLELFPMIADWREKDPPATGWDVWLAARVREHGETLTAVGAL